MFKIPRSITRWKSILERMKYIEYIESKILRSIRPDLFCKKDLAKFTGKHLRQSLFFNKVAAVSL